MPSEPHLKKFNSWKAKWENQDKMSRLDYISFNVHPEDVLILQPLLFPSFIEFKGHVFLEDRFSLENFELWNGKLGGGRMAIEKMINHVHVYDIFGHCQDDVEDAVFEGVAKMLKVSWEKQLSIQFPNKEVAVELFNSEADYGPTLVVYSKR